MTKTFKQKKGVVVLAIISLTVCLFRRLFSNILLGENKTFILLKWIWDLSAPKQFILEGKVSNYRQKLTLNIINTCMINHSCTEISTLIYFYFYLMVTNFRGVISMIGRTQHIHFRK